MLNIEKQRQTKEWVIRLIWRRIIREDKFGECISRMNRVEWWSKIEGNRNSNGGIGSKNGIKRVGNKDRVIKKLRSAQTYWKSWTRFAFATIRSDQIKRIAEGIFRSKVKRR